jgi:hypothetical protein
LSVIAVVFHFRGGKVIVVVLLLDFFAEIACVISSILRGWLEPRQNLLSQVMAIPTRVMAAPTQVMAAPTLPLLRTVEHSRPFENKRSFKLLENVLQMDKC